MCMDKVKGRTNPEIRNSHERVKSCVWKDSLMTSFEFYTDRAAGIPAAVAGDRLQEQTSRALRGLVLRLVKSNNFAKSFPVLCQDNNGIIGTDEDGLWDSMRGFVPKLPGWMNDEWPDEHSVLFDVLEYVAKIIAKPSNNRFHEYFQHYELEFDESAGRLSFRDEVNGLLHRGRTPYEMNDKFAIVRPGSLIVQEVASGLVADSGDDKLDTDLRRAVENYRSRAIDTRKGAIETLWDVFERLKTLDIPGDKKASTQVLIGKVPEEIQPIIEAEMKSLTGIGNSFEIRHHETGKTPVPEEAYDYLFSRMGALLEILLGCSGWLADE